MVVFLGRAGNRGCQLVGLAVEGHSKGSGLEATVVWMELSGCSGAGIGAGGMAGVLVGYETRGGGLTELFGSEGNDQHCFICSIAALFSMSFDL